MKYSPAIFLLCLFFLNLLPAQRAAPQLGIRTSEAEVFLLTNCKIFVTPDNIIENGKILVRNGRIKAVGKNVPSPKDALVKDLNGAWVYPGFVDPYSAYGLPEVKKPEKKGRGTPQYNRESPGPYAWNEALKPEFEAARNFKPDEKKARKIREMGFTTLNVTPRDGILRGTSALVNLTDEPVQYQLFKNQLSVGLSFEKGSSGQNYPSSLMGSIALIRQTLLDADWYAKAQSADRKSAKLETNLSLEALNQHLSKNLPLIFETGDYLHTLRAASIAQEFNLRFICKTSGDEYKAALAIRSKNIPLILSVDYPKALNVNDVALAGRVDLGRMKDWEQMPAGPAMLKQEGISFALTADGINKKEDFYNALRLILEHGLSERDLLEALTLAPAKILGVENDFGSLEEGKLANLIVSEGNIFEKDNALYQVWVKGKKFELNPMLPFKLKGTYDLTAGEQRFEMEITGKSGEWKIKAQPVGDTVAWKGKFELASDLSVVFHFVNEKAPTTSGWRFAGRISGSELAGYGDSPEGSRFAWTATRTGELEEKKEKEEEGRQPDLEKVKHITYPNKAYGFESLPVQGEYLIKNATVWTNTEKGILQNADVHFRDGKIQAVGVGLNAPEAQTIDGTGKHVTTGIVDEHSHIAISRGVNEGTHAVTAEVRIGDVINSEDVNIYRQLAGGVTTSQLLHGSANPIGGQSALIKLRWGSLPEEMKIRDAKPFIKFALGENVKQSNWGDAFKERYPQTRPGVEQIMKDAFMAAQDYQKRWKQSSGRGNSPYYLPPRVDLQMEALLQILNSERFITCHSYVQSELNMLMKLAESFGFRVNTFTHVLEGYKIADKLKAHGANASTFSDWWAYKYEVIDAIPYNAALLAQQGVNACINSDDAEMGRRLNQEAAKAVKYGGLSEEEALKLVTLNPAKALRLDHRLGSLKRGMDADLVLWSGHPLSVYTRAEKTFVDGKLYFDLARDAEMRKDIRAERVRLIARIMASKDKAKDGKKWKKEQRLYHCDTLQN